MDLDTCEDPGIPASSDVPQDSVLEQDENENFPSNLRIFEAAKTSEIYAKTIQVTSVLAIHFHLSRDITIFWCYKVKRMIRRLNLSQDL